MKENLAKYEAEKKEEEETWRRTLEASVATQTQIMDGLRKAMAKIMELEETVSALQSENEELKAQLDQ